MVYTDRHKKKSFLINFNNLETTRKARNWSKPFSTVCTTSNSLFLCSFHRQGWKWWVMLANRSVSWPVKDTKLIMLEEKCHCIWTVKGYFIIIRKWRVSKICSSSNSNIQPRYKSTFQSTFRISYKNMITFGCGVFFQLLLHKTHSAFTRCSSSKSLQTSGKLCCIMFPFCYGSF